MIPQDRFRLEIYRSLISLRRFPISVRCFPNVNPYRFCNHIGLVTHAFLITGSSRYAWLWYAQVNVSYMYYCLYLFHVLLLIWFINTRYASPFTILRDSHPAIPIPHDSVDLKFIGLDLNEWEYNIDWERKRKECECSRTENPSGRTAKACL